MLFDYQKALFKISTDLLQSGNNNEALFQLQRLVTHFPNDTENHRLFGDGYLQSGLLPQARDEYAAALAISPDHDSASIGMVKYLWLSGSIDEAKERLQEIQVRSPQNAESYLVAGQIEMVSGNMQACITALRTAAEIQPHNVLYHRELGRAYYSAGQMEEAEKVLRHAATLKPADAVVFNLLATIHWKNGQTETALVNIRQALELAPQNPEVRKNFSAIASAQSMIKKDRKLVVFVGDWPRTRHAKIAYGLRNAGYRAVLLCKNALGNDMSSYFDEVCYYKDDWQALALAGTFSPLVYHVFSIWSESTAVAMIKHKPGKVVYDCYDVVEGINGAESSIPDQKYCLENANALCCRDLRIQYLKRELNYHLPPKKIFFPEYCWGPNDPSEISESSRLEKDGEIHAVAVGAFDVEKLGRHDFGFLQIARQFAAQGIHLHIYPSPMQMVSGTFEEIFSDYIDLQRQTPFFHLHYPVPLEKVIPELKKYHIALHIVAPILQGTPMNRYAPFQMQYGGPARMYDYLDAGLPVLSHKELAHNYFLFSRYGLVKDTNRETLSDLRHGLRLFLKDSLTNRINIARSQYAIRNQIHRLTEFYDNI